ncbi:hypothetical protein B0H13DRAFT_2383893 [Mycena leptocephala]|nr:hypothetical protein B0H13DRAFT_2383893 [Mycena leptocephala]
MAPTTNRPSTGPPQALVARMEYFQKLLKHLPLSLPLEREDSTYRFYLDEDRIADAGSVFPEAGRALEISFGTWKMGAVVRCKERGARVAALGPFLKGAVKRMSASERVSFEEAWINRLIQAVKDSGAAVPSSTSQVRECESEEEESVEQPPSKKTRTNAPIVLDSDDDMPPSIPTPSTSTTRQTLVPGAAIPSTSHVNLVSNTQATLATMGWQKWLPGAKEAHLKSAADAHRESAAETLQRKEQEAESKRERERILNAERQRRFREKKRMEKEVEKEAHLSDDDNANIVWYYSECTSDIGYRHRGCYSGEGRRRTGC